MIINYEKSLSYSSLKHIIVEPLIREREASIFYMAKNGKIHLAAMGDRHTNYFYGGIIPLPVAYTFPSKYLEKYQHTLNHKVIDMLKSIGIKNGIIFIQSFIENGNCIFYETGYRLSGILEYKLINHACNIDLMGMMIKFALTGKMSNGANNINPNFHNHYCNITFNAKPGIIGEVQGIEEVLRIPNVIDAVFTYEKGDIIPVEALGTRGQVVARVWAFAKTKLDLVDTADKIRRTIKVFSPEGKNILLSAPDAIELFN